MIWLAGFDTSSTALSFALYELAKNQTFQAIIRREIQEFDTKGKPSLEQTDLADFPFTQACLLVRFWGFKIATQLHYWSAHSLTLLGQSHFVGIIMASILRITLPLTKDFLKHFYLPHKPHMFPTDSLEYCLINCQTRCMV